MAGQVLGSMVQGAIANVRFEHRFVRGDGREIWCKMCTSLIKDNKGMPQFLFLHIEDTTKCKHNMEMLKETVHDVMVYLKSR